MIIDTSYFQYKPVFIPNSIAQPSVVSNLPNSVGQLQKFIDDKEYTFLLNALGYDQTTELLSQFESNGGWKPAALQKWKDLVDGKNGWRGLKYTVGVNKISMIAYYVFFYFLGEDYKSYTTTGVQSPNVENSETVYPNSKQAKAWNTFVRMYNGDMIRGGRPTFFSNWNGEGMMWAGGTLNRNEVTLYQFLSENNEVYDITKFNFEYTVNSFGL